MDQARHQGVAGTTVLTTSMRGGIACQVASGANQMRPSAPLEITTLGIPLACSAGALGLLAQGLHGTTGPLAQLFQVGFDQGRRRLDPSLNAAPLQSKITCLPLALSRRIRWPQ